MNFTPVSDLLTKSALILLILSVCIHPLHAMEKMSDAELRAVTGQAGFIESEEDLKRFKEARDGFKSLIRSQGLKELLPEKNRKQLFGNTDLKPEREAELIQSATRNLLKSRKFLKTVENTARSVAKLAKTLKQLRSLQ